MPRTTCATCALAGFRCSCLLCCRSGAVDRAACVPGCRGPRIQSGPPQEPPPPPDAGRRSGGGCRARPRRRRAQPPQPRPYEQVITSEARTDEGVFKVHRIREQLFYEIPKAELGKDFLWVSQIKRTTAGAGLGGEAAGNRVVRWELLGNRVLLRLVDYSIVADPSTPIARAVADANNPAIVRAFNVAAFSPAGDPVIEVDAAVPDRGSGAVGARADRRARIRSEPDASSRRSSRSPRTSTSRSMQTYTAPVDAGGRARRPARQPAARGMRGNSATVVDVVQHGEAAREADDAAAVRRARRLLHAQHVRLRPRTSTRATQRTFITRYRLEKRDPNAEISEPVKPIVYYVDPATPAKWVPYVKKGIEDWQPAFEARRIPQRHRRARRAGRRSGLESGGRALLGDSLAAVDDRERVRARTFTIRARARFSKRTSSSTTTCRTC